ncbi:restriction endonuclease [Acidithiobacillus thiooxidans]|uniref:restriction endonuclease subunit S n=1 Tax=Acidithiobacillus thiooxidans TaxID=930 RepID=UPI0029C04A59|nr:restriction endonuclease subunit S [Acidithiobacillus thiooxidans]MBU2793098.1 restriction endonuclease [Acidithiobacillus thiooxidans]
MKWGAFSFGRMFNRIAQGHRLKKEDQTSGDLPFVMAGITNTGVVNYVSNLIERFPANSITVDIFGNTFYRDYVFGAGDDTGVYWSTEKHYSKAVMLFLAAAMRKSLEGQFDYGKKLRSSQSLNLKMMLPVKNGEPDFAFIEKFIPEFMRQLVTGVEHEHVEKVNAYLAVTGLKDCTLTAEEQKAVDDYTHVVRMDRTKLEAFRLETLFGMATRGKRLKSADRIPGSLPFVTAGEKEEGVSAFIGNDVTVFPENTTTIDMFGSAKYRNYAYGADDHVAVVHTENLPKNAAIFVTAAIHKASYTGKFDYGRNFYAKDADDLVISLPVKDGEPNYDFMALLIAAIQKLVIKDVILFAERRIAAYRKAICS